MDLTGQNIANANTPGYHLQVAELAPQSDGQSVGTGVDVTTIKRVISEVLDQAVNNNASATQNVTAQLSAMQQAQTLVSPSSGSLDDLLQGFFDQATLLSSNPADPTQRQAFLSSATSLTDGLNSVGSGLDQLESGLNTQAQQVVGSINGILPQIAALNGQIQSATLAGTPPNDLMDQRDELISNLASLADVSTVDEGSGMTGVNIGGIPVVQGTQSSPLTISTNPNTNTTTVQAADSTASLTISDGQLGGLLQAVNQAVPALQQQVNSFTQQLISSVNEIQATAIPLTGSYTDLIGNNPVTSTSIPLAQAGLASTPQAGTLYVTVINNATGAQTLTAVPIDPATQSLQGVAAAISAVPNIQAVVNSQNGTLSVLAQPGYTFNFAGGLPTSPQTTANTGTAVPQLSGSYTGTANDQYTFTVVGSGTVGVTPNLSLQVTDKSRAVLGNFNIGSGYSAGLALQTVNGVNVQLSAGTVNNGDSFGTDVVANPDSAGLLSALGLNSFFQGTSADTIAVNPNLTANPNNLALSHTGQSADGSALQQLAALQNTPLLANGTESLQGYLTSMVGNVGTSVQNLTSQQTSQQTVGQQLQAQQQAVSGVDTNTALVQLTQYQQSYQMAAHYFSVLDATFTSLMDIT